MGDGVSHPRGLFVYSNLARLQMVVRWFGRYVFQFCRVTVSDLSTLVPKSDIILDYGRSSFVVACLMFDKLCYHANSLCSSINIYVAYGLSQCHLSSFHNRFTPLVTLSQVHVHSW